MLSNSAHNKHKHINILLGNEKQDRNNLNKKIADLHLRKSMSNLNEKNNLLSNLANKTNSMLNCTKSTNEQMNNINNNSLKATSVSWSDWNSEEKANGQFKKAVFVIDVPRDAVKTSLKSQNKHMDTYLSESTNTPVTSTKTVTTSTNSNEDSSTDVTTTTTTTTITTTTKTVIKLNDLNKKKNMCKLLFNLSD